MDKIPAILKELKDVLRDTLGWTIAFMLLLLFVIYNQNKDIDALKTDNKNLNEQNRNAYNHGQDDCIEKTVEQMKVMQSIGIILKQNTDMQKKQQVEDKKLIKKLDNIKSELK